MNFLKKKASILKFGSCEERAMKAYTIKNKEGKYFGVANSYNYEHYWTTLAFAHYFRHLEGHDAKQEAEEFRDERYPDCEVVEITIAEGDLEEQLAEKDKEIEELEESNGVTRALCKNYYTQLQNYKSKLYGIDIPKLRKKHLTPEEKEIYYKGFENCERQFASQIADITIEIRKQVCSEIRKYIAKEYDMSVEDIPRHCHGLAWSIKDIYELLDQIEKGEE